MSKRAPGMPSKAARPRVAQKDSTINLRELAIIQLGAVPDNPLWRLSWELCGRAVSAGTNRTV